MENQQSKSLHIAVTGHRYLPPDHCLHQSIRQVLRNIHLEHENKNIYLYSALAEGADQLVAKIALEFKDVKLYVPLPLPAEAYLGDFYSEDGKESFAKMMASANEVFLLSPQGNHQDAYQALGEYLVMQADILLAVWNGVFNHKKGGTSEVIRAALIAKKLVYWIYCKNEKPGEINSLEGIKQIGAIEILK